MKVYVCKKSDMKSPIVVSARSCEEAFGVAVKAYDHIKFSVCPDDFTEAPKVESLSENPEVLIFNC